MSVEQASRAVLQMREASSAVRDLVAGGEHMRARGEARLPKFPMETDEAYKARKENSWLFDGVGKALDDYVDRLFDKPIIPLDAGQLAEWCANIDMEGRDLSNFAQDVFTRAVQDGIAFILADSPPRPEGNVTRAQAAAMNLRPYLVCLTLDDVLGWQTRTESNVPIVSQLRILEEVTVQADDEFEEATIKQVRVLDHPEGGPVSVRLFQEIEKRGWVVVDEYTTQMDRIMLAPVYTKRTGFMAAKPPLARLAELNLAHWRSQSDQSNILHYARVPMKIFAGWQTEDLENMIQGAGYALATSNPDAKATTLEHGGPALAAGREELKDLEQQMQWVGLQLVMSRASGATATGDRMDEKKNISALSRWADNLKDALEISLANMLEIGGINGDPDVSMSRDYLAINMNSADMETLIKMGVSDETLLREAKRRGMLSEDVDVDEEAERMASVMDVPDGAS